MKLDPRALAAALLPGAAMALVLGAAAAVLAATAAPAERAALWALVEPRLMLVVLVWGLASIAAGVALRAAWNYHGAGPERLAEQLQVLLAEAPGRSVALRGTVSAGSRALAGAVNGLLQQRRELSQEIAQKVAEASREVEQERSRLAALMAELTQSVVVCNLDGRILLFNARARSQLRVLAGGDGPRIGGAEAVALGRSVYAVLDRRLVAHALEAVQQRLARGTAHPSAQFVTASAGGQLLRVQLAPVRETGATAPDAPLNGFVLMIDNVTREIAEGDESDRLLHQLTEGSRGAVGNLQAAVELLDDPDIDAATRERFLGVIRDEIATLSRRINEAASASAQAMKTRWPLEDMLGADLAAAAARRIELACESRVQLAEVDAALWLRVESYSIIQALLHLALRLEQGWGTMRMQLRLAPAEHGGGKAQLDLVFPAQPMSTETVVAWETEPLEGTSGTAALTLRDVVQRHGGALWFERDRARQRAFFRFLLPLAGGAAARPEAPAAPRPESRPEFYDFDLFKPVAGGAGAALAERRLDELTYTVFDTETTGLDPGAGDEIIQIGATRIVAGKLRRQDSFDQLVDPQRSVPEAGIAIHGIRPEMLRGQPTIDAVLPAFHDFAADSVLVAHNAAFDMRFLQLKEQRTGVRFDMPVLDTLLLSAALHPAQESHALEAIADRLGVPVLSRHTALGDALVTAEVFVKMIPLLQAAGITTLSQALAASRKTYLARVGY